MKRIYHKIALAVMILLVGATACKKSFLETIPAGKIVAQTTSDYDLLLSSSPLLQIGNANAQVFMGDEVAAVDPYFTASPLKNQASFRWDPDLYLAVDNAGEMTSTMQNIYQYNKIINEVPNSSGGSDNQKLEVAAEAMAGRAWIYFLLINYYGKPYNPTTAATDPGFPIITAADVTTTQFTRATVQQVYDFIVKDLTTAIPNLPSQITFRTRMSKAAAEATLGKVYMFMGRYTDALTQFNAAFTDMASPATPVRLYDYNVEFATGGVFLPLSTSSGPTYPNLPNNIEILYAKQINLSNTNELVITPQTSALFGSTDLRLKLFSNTLSFSTTTYSVPVTGLLRRWAPSFNAPIGFQVPELYLLRAEAKCRTNDLSGAKTDVEALRVKRMPAADAPVPAAVASQQLPLLKFILDERTREFAMQGFRWFDMRRLSVDPLFSSTTYSHTLYSATGSTTTFQLKPERFTLRFPQSVLDQNPGVSNNP